MSPTQAKFIDRIAASGLADPGGFGRNQTFKVNKIKQDALDQLALDYGSLNPNQGFMGKDNGAFGNRINVTNEIHLP